MLFHGSMSMAGLCALTDRHTSAKATPTPAPTVTLQVTASWALLIDNPGMFGSLTP